MSLTKTRRIKNGKHTTTKCSVVFNVYTVKYNAYSNWNIETYKLEDYVFDPKVPHTQNAKGFWYPYIRQLSIDGLEANWFFRKYKEVDEILKATNEAGLDGNNSLIFDMLNAFEKLTQTKDGLDKEDGIKVKTHETIAKRRLKRVHFA